MPKTPRQKIISKKHLARIERERRQTRYIVIGSIAIILLVVGSIGYGILQQNVLEPAKPVAIVNGDKISAREFEENVRYIRGQLVQQYDQYLQLGQMFGSDPQSQQYIQQYLDQITSQLDPVTLGGQVLDSLIEDRLIRQEAKRRAITVSAQELDTYIQEQFGYFANETPTPSPTSPPLVEPTLSATQLALVSPTPTMTPTATATVTPFPQFTPTPTQVLTPTATATPYTLDAFNNNYKTTVQNISKSLNIPESEFRYIIESQLYQKKVLDAVTAGTPHDQEQVWARHILVNDEATAKDLRLRLDEGQDFGKLAKESSTDTGTKDQGGDLGWFAKSAMIPEFANAAFSLKVGEISQPIQTTYGWHIIQVLGHENRSLTETQYSQLLQQNFQDWVTQQRDSGKVETFDFWKQIVPSVPAVTSQVDAAVPSGQ